MTPPQLCGHNPRRYSFAASSAILSAILFRNFKQERAMNQPCLNEVHDLHLLRYQEWQERDGRSTGRLSSAVFRDRHDAPNAVEWLHLHETWLPNSTEE